MLCVVMNLFVFFLLYFGAVSTQIQEYPCPELLTLDITDGVKFKNQSILKNNTLFEPNNYYSNQSKILGCICKIKPCVRKCCGPNEHHVGKCVQTEEKLELKIHKGTQQVDFVQDYHYIHKICNITDTLLLPKLEESHLFYLQENGSLYLPNYNPLKPLKGLHEYCMETFTLEGMGKMVSGLLCASDEDMEEEENVNMWNSIGE